jgi:hypothetical protein
MASDLKTEIKRNDHVWVVPINETLKPWTAIFIRWNVDRSMFEVDGFGWPKRCWIKVACFGGKVR